MFYGKEGQRDLPPFEFNSKINDPSLYMPSDGLVDAVNVALAIGQPLLLTGEPGTGKTQLAYHLAHFFKLGKPLLFSAQTTSIANDLFYRYDALGHFQYNRNNSTPLTIAELEQKYIKYQALGEAIKENKRAVVLIDEIDKAPRDLPNDLLLSIEKLRFTVPEIGETFETQSNNRPIIIITSNSEKNLPEAFLRRVTYFHISFPDATTLLQILNKKFDGINDAQLTEVITHFNNIRNSKTVRLKKNPATAELIFWVMYLQKEKFDFLKINQKMDEKNAAILKTSYSILAKNQDDLITLKGK